MYLFPTVMHAQYMCKSHTKKLLSVLVFPHAGMEVVLVVNNLGGTSNLELSIMTNAAIRYLGMHESLTE